MGEELVLSVLFLLQKSFVILGEIVFFVVLFILFLTRCHTFILILVIRFFFLLSLNRFRALLRLFLCIIGFFGLFILPLHLHATINSLKNPRDTLKQQQLIVETVNPELRFERSTQEFLVLILFDERTNWIDFLKHFNCRDFLPSSQPAIQIQQYFHYSFKSKLALYLAIDFLLRFSFLVF